MYFLGVRTLFVCGVLLVISSITHGSPANIATYDQSQKGDVNIHISLKDVKIIALMGGGLGGSEDYDYNYDYSELTVKPPHSNNNTSTSTVATTTKKPTQDIVYENILTTTEKVVEITPPSPILNLKPNSTALNPTHKPNSTILHATHKLNGTDIPNKNHTFTNAHRPSNIRPNNTAIPVQILTTPVEIVYNHKDTKNSTSTLKPETSPATILTSTMSSTTAGLRQEDCIEGYRKDQRGICRPRVKRPTQQTLLRKLIQLSHRMQTLPNKRVHPNQ